MTSIKRQILISLLRHLTLGLIIFVAGSLASLSGQNLASDELKLQKCWEYGLANGGDGRLAADDSTIFVAHGSVVEAIVSETGAKLWSTDIGGAVDSNLIVSGRNLFFVRRVVPTGNEKVETATVSSLSTATGITKWNAFVAGGQGFTLGVVGSRLAVLARNGAIQFVTMTDGSTTSSSKLPGSVLAAPIFTDSQSLVVTDGTRINSVNGDGEPTTIKSVSFNVSVIYRADSEILAWGDDRGNLTLYSLSSDSVVWQFKSGGGISDIAMINGKLIVSSNDNFIYAVSPGNGNRIWKKRISGRVASIHAVGIDAVLIHPTGDDNIVFLRVRDGKVVDQIAFNEQELATASLVTDGSRFVVLTDRSVYAYNVGSCT